MHNERDMCKGTIESNRISAPSAARQTTPINTRSKQKAWSLDKWNFKGSPSPLSQRDVIPWTRFTERDCTHRDCLRYASTPKAVFPLADVGGSPSDLILHSLNYRNYVLQPNSSPSLEIKEVPSFSMLLQYFVHKSLEQLSYNNIDICFCISGPHQAVTDPILISSVTGRTQHSVWLWWMSRKVWWMNEWMESQLDFFFKKPKLILIL